MTVNLKKHCKVTFSLYVFLFVWLFYWWQLIIFAEAFGMYYFNYIRLTTFLWFWSSMCFGLLCVCGYVCLFEDMVWEVIFFFFLYFSWICWPSLFKPSYAAEYDMNTMVVEWFVSFIIGCNIDHNCLLFFNNNFWLYIYLMHYWTFVYKKGTCRKPCLLCYYE